MGKFGTYAKMRSLSLFLAANIMFMGTSYAKIVCYSETATDVMSWHTGNGLMSANSYDVTKTLFYTSGTVVQDASFNNCINADGTLSIDCIYEQIITGIDNGTLQAWMLGGGQILSFNIQYWHAGLGNPELYGVGTEGFKIMHPRGAVQFSGLPTTVCTNEGQTSLVGVASAGGGSWSGPGVTNQTEFDPSQLTAGQHTISYTVAHPAHTSCSISFDHDVQVQTEPVITISQQPSVTIGDVIVDLNDYVSPTGGNYYDNSGSIMSSQTYPCYQGIGSYTIWYSYQDQNGCYADSFNFTLTVADTNLLSPAVITPTLQDTSIYLWSNLWGGPLYYNGSFSGMGVTPGTAATLGAGILNPCVAGPGNHMITYDGCGSTMSVIEAKISPVPLYTSAFPTVYNNDVTLNMNNHVGVYDGMFSGTGVLSWPSWYFNSSFATAGTHAVTYEYCGVVETQSIVVVKDPGIPTTPLLVQGTVYPFAPNGQTYYRGRICDGGSFTLTVFDPDSGATYTWFDEAYNLLGVGDSIQLIANNQSGQVEEMVVFVFGSNSVYTGLKRRVSIEVFPLPVATQVLLNTNSECVEDSAVIELSYSSLEYVNYEFFRTGSAGLLYDTVLAQATKLLVTNDQNGVVDTLSGSSVDTVSEQVTRNNAVTVSGGPPSTSCTITNSSTSNITGIELFEIDSGVVYSANNGLSQIYQDLTCSGMIFLEVNGSYEFRITHDTVFPQNIPTPHSTGAWIDFNANGVFESSETLYNSQNVYLAQHTFTFVVDSTVPLNTPLRLRIASHLTVPVEGCPTNSAFYASVGEVEDYSIVFQLPTYETGFLVDKSQVCYDQVTFTDIGLDQVIGRYWDFGDGNIDSSGQYRVTHTYTFGGSYNVSLTREKLVYSDTVLSYVHHLSNDVSTIYAEAAVIVNDDAGGLGCYVGINDTLVVKRIPEVAFSVMDSVLCEPGGFQTSDQSDALDSLLWSFGNGIGDTVLDPEVFYVCDSATNVFMISLSGYRNGCMSADSTAVTVLRSPVANFTLQDSAGCVPFIVEVEDSSMYSISSVWRFGVWDTISLSSGTDTTYEFTFISYQDSTVEEIKLVNTANGICKDSITKTITVYPDVLANFSNNIIPVLEVGDAIMFINNSNGSTSQHWDFGDNNYSWNLSPWHYYYLVGAHDITLEVMNDYGCADTLTLNDYVIVGYLTNTKDLNSGVGLRIYPNPFNDVLVIDNFEGADIRFELLNEMGSFVNGIEVVRQGGSIVIEGVQMLPAGTYFLKIGDRMFKLIKL